MCWEGVERSGEIDHRMVECKQNLVTCMYHCTLSSNYNSLDFIWGGGGGGGGGALGSLPEFENDDVTISRYKVAVVINMQLLTYQIQRPNFLLNKTILRTFNLCYNVRLCWLQHTDHRMNVRFAATIGMHTNGLRIRQQREPTSRTASYTW